MTLFESHFDKLLFLWPDTDIKSTNNRALFKNQTKY